MAFKNLRRFITCARAREKVEGFELPHHAQVYLKECTTPRHSGFNFMEPKEVLAVIREIADRRPRPHIQSNHTSMIRGYAA